MFRQLKKEDLNNAIDFCFFWNNINETAQSFCSKSKPSIRKDLEDCIKEGLAFGAYDNEKLVGIINGFLQMEHSNLDCVLIIANDLKEPFDYERIAQELITSLQRQHSTKVTYKFYFPIENSNCLNFLKNFAHREMNEYVLKLTKGQQSLPEDTSYLTDVHLLSPQYFTRFPRLHQEIFGDIYITGEEIISELNTKYLVFTETLDDQLIAYSTLRKTNSNLAFVEVVGVKKQYRHMGHGRKVLSYLINRAFEDQYTEIELIVDADNDNALRLYSQLGFKQEQVNVCFTYLLK